MLPTIVPLRSGGRAAFLVSFLGMVIIIIIITMSVVLSILSRNRSRNLPLKRTNGTKNKKKTAKTNTKLYLLDYIPHEHTHAHTHKKKRKKKKKAKNQQTGSDIAVCYFGENLSSTRSFAPPLSGRSQPNCLPWVILTALEAAYHLTAQTLPCSKHNICYDVCSFIWMERQQ